MEGNRETVEKEQVRKKQAFGRKDPLQWLSRAAQSKVKLQEGL